MGLSTQRPFKQNIIEIVVVIVVVVIIVITVEEKVLSDQWKKKKKVLSTSHINIFFVVPWTSWTGWAGGRVYQKMLGENIQNV